MGRGIPRHRNVIHFATKDVKSMYRNEPAGAADEFRIWISTGLNMTYKKQIRPTKWQAIFIFVMATIYIAFFIFQEFQFFEGIHKYEYFLPHSYPVLAILCFLVFLMIFYFRPSGFKRHLQRKFNTFFHPAVFCFFQLYLPVGFLLLMAYQFTDILSIIVSFIVISILTIILIVYQALKIPVWNPEDSCEPINTVDEKTSGSEEKVKPGLWTQVFFAIAIIVLILEISALGFYYLMFKDISKIYSAAILVPILFFVISLLVVYNRMEKVPKNRSFSQFFFDPNIFVMVMCVLLAISGIICLFNGNNFNELIQAGLVLSGVIIFWVLMKFFTRPS